MGQHESRGSCGQINRANAPSGMSSITDHPSKAAVEDDGESEVEEEVDELMEEDEDVNQTCGQSNKWGRAQGTPHHSSACASSQSRAWKVITDAESSPKEGACDPCKQRKIGCTQATHHHTPYTTRRSKAAPTTNTPGHRNPSRAQKTPRRRDKSPSTEPEDVEEPPARKKHSIVIPAPKQAASYAILPSHRAETSATTPIGCHPLQHQIPELLMWVDAITDRQDVILAWVNDLERWIMGLDTQTQGPTPGLTNDRIHMLEGELAKFQWTVATLTWEVKALQLKVQDITTPDIQEAAIQNPTPMIEPVEDAIVATHGDQESTIITMPEGSVPSDKLATTPTATAMSQEPAPAIELSEAVSMAEMDISRSKVESNQGTGEVVMAAEVCVAENSGTSTTGDMEVTGP
ncbi:hypothetical protein EDD15DRAFT_2198408 [Pisolithus albus]|nr:hypothetical protein EDD15DRAFT_2198408 [Pisolithus albus]